MKCSSTSSLKLERKIHEMKDEAIHQSEAADAFRRLSIYKKTPQTANYGIVGSPSIGMGNILLVPTWLAHLVEDLHPTDYIRARRKLSDAAYWVIWTDFWSFHRSAIKIYQELWANAIRTSK